MRYFNFLKFFSSILFFFGVDVVELGGESGSRLPAPVRSEVEFRDWVSVSAVDHVV